MTVFLATNWLTVLDFLSVELAVGSVLDCSYDSAILKSLKIVLCEAHWV